MRAHSLLFILALTTSPLTWADLLLIVNSKNSTAALERKQVIDIFMGRTTAFPNQLPVHPLDVVNSRNLRAVFYKNLTGKNEAQVDAYWATLIFAGRMLPPEKLPDEAAVINAVNNNPTAIGYITRQTLPEGIKVVLEIPITK